MDSIPANWKVKKYASHWLQNKDQITKIACANFFVALSGEFIVRQVLVSWGYFPDHAAFLHSSGIIHPQALINISMSVIASLFGGVVYFLDTLKKRYIFFVAFAFLSSILVQSFLAFSVNLPAALVFKRLLFDVAYTGSIKFVSFEIFRSPIKNHNSGVLKIFAFRKVQDLSMAFIKINLLVFCGL